MTSFLIGYPDIPFRAASMSASDTVDASYPVKNLATGGRGSMFRLSSAVTAPWVKASLPAATTASIQYFFMARANLIKAAGATRVRIQRSSDDTNWFDVIGTLSNYQTRTFTGPRSEDLLFTSSFNDEIGSYTATAYQYWRLTFNGTAQKYMFSKWYCGSWFDFGREPELPLTKYRVYGSNSERESKRIFKIRWRGIDDATRNLFFDKIARYADFNPVVLYDSGDYCLDGIRTFHAWLDSYSIRTITYNSNEITADFVEAL